MCVHRPMSSGAAALILTRKGKGRLQRKLWIGKKLAISLAIISGRAKYVIPFRMAHGMYHSANYAPGTSSFPDSMRPSLALLQHSGSKTPAQFSRNAISTYTQVLSTLVTSALSSHRGVSLRLNRKICHTCQADASPIPTYNSSP